jgi:hypothetical protein
MAWQLRRSLLFSGYNSLMCQAYDINRRTFNAHGSGLKLRYFQQAINNAFKMIAGRCNRNQEFMPFLSRNAALMPQQRDSIALDGGERAAQFMAHRCQQFRLEERAAASPHDLSGGKAARTRPFTKREPLLY